MTERETILAICKRLGISLTYIGSEFNFIEVPVPIPSDDSVIATIWFNDDETVDSITFC